MQKVTILTCGGLGNIVVTHAKLVEHGRKPYAQYKSAPYVRYIKKNARKVRGAVFAYNPYLLILDGWQDIKSQNIFGKPYISSTGQIILQSRYSSYDSCWEETFNKVLKFKNIIADYRGVNSHEII